MSLFEQSPANHTVPCPVRANASESRNPGYADASGYAPMKEEIIKILKSGGTVELKLVAGQIQVIEIRRKKKISIPLETGQAEG